MEEEEVELPYSPGSSCLGLPCLHPMGLEVRLSIGVVVKVADSCFVVIEEVGIKGVTR